MKAGNLSESEGSDAFWVPLYSSIYLRESHVQGNRFDLENPGLDRALACREWLTSRGWSEPIFADSGNGAHLLCRVSLPTDDYRYVELSLKALASQFDDDDVLVDVGNYNLIAFVEKVTLQSHEITREDIDLLRAHGFSDADVLDIASAAAARSFYSKMVDSLGVEPSPEWLERSESVLGQELLQTLTVGRPFSNSDGTQITL